MLHNCSIVCKITYYYLNEQKKQVKNANKKVKNDYFDVFRKKNAKMFGGFKK